MTKKPSELPAIKKLPLSAGEFPAENWNFIEEKIAGNIIDSGETREALFYEMARVLFDEDRLIKGVLHFFQSAAEGYFPNFPFLKLPAPIRKSLVAEIRDSKNSLIIGPTFTTSPIAVRGIIQYPLETELQFELEQIAYAAAAEVSDQIPGSCPEDFMPPTTASEKAVNEKLNHTMASKDPRIDRSRCSLTLDVDFTRSTTEIVEEFEKIITQERDKWKQPIDESRGKTRQNHLLFREVAIYRLFGQYKSVTRVCEFLDNKGIDSSEIYKSPKGWNDARDRATKCLDNLKITLGEKTHHPQARSKKPD